jgi:hypothetical protein
MNPSSAAASEDMLGWRSKDVSSVIPTPYGVVFPASIDRRVVTPVNASELFSQKLLKAIELNAAALETLNRLEMEVREACGMCPQPAGGDVAPKSKRQRCGVKESSEICKALSSLKRAVKKTSETVEGFRMTLIDDINCGATPPFILSEALRYGLDVHQVCMLCGQAINRDNEIKMPHTSVAEMIFSWHHSR